MRRKIGVCLNIMILFLCLLPYISFGKDSTVIKLNVYEVTINCEEKGNFLVGDNKYTKTHKILVGHSENLCVKIIPNKGYEVDSISGTSGCDITFSNGKLEVKNIDNNIVINIKFKEKLKNEVISTITPNKKPNTNTETNTNTNTIPGNPDENVIVNNLELKPTEKDNEFSYGKGNSVKKCCCLCWLILLIILLIIIYIIWKRRKIKQNY